MKAVLLQKAGANALAEMAVGEMPLPLPTPGTVRVRVTHASTNPVDFKMAEYGFLVKSWPVVLGCDLAGVVDEVGEGVDPAIVEKGDVVYGFPDLGTQFGAFAECSIVNQKFLGRVPKGLTPAEASTLAVGSQTAYLALCFNGKLLPPSQAADKYKNSSVIVWGAAGSVGSYAVQFAKAQGHGRIIGVCSPGSAENVKSLGATHTVDYRSGNAVQELKDLTKDFPCLVAVDSVGAESAKQLVEVFRDTPDRPVILACVAGSPKEAIPVHITISDVLLGDCYSVPEKQPYCAQAVKEVDALCAAGKFKANRIYDGGKGLESVPAALQIHKEGKNRGDKVVITF
eukprot:m.113380 g.113380  ORF g.113380 m.113380 type:complete len:342 (+) comp19310_c11_seq1:2705-3730(+)